MFSGNERSAAGCDTIAWLTSGPIVPTVVSPNAQNMLYDRSYDNDGDHLHPLDTAGHHYGGVNSHLRRSKSIARCWRVNGFGPDPSASRCCHGALYAVTEVDVQGRILMPHSQVRSAAALPQPGSQNASQRWPSRILLKRPRARAQPLRFQVPPDHQLARAPQCPRSQSHWDRLMPLPQSGGPLTSPRQAPPRTFRGSWRARMHSLSASLRAHHRAKWGPTTQPVSRRQDSWPEPQALALPSHLRRLQAERHFGQRTNERKPLTRRRIPCSCEGGL